MKQQFLKAKTGTLRLTAYGDNRPLVPADSVTVTLYKPEGSALETDASASRDATTGEMTYSLTTTHTATNDLNYKVVWKYVVGGATYYETQLFDVVLSILSIPITDDDLYDELESLREAAIQGNGTATAGAAGTLTDTLNRKEIDDFWTGGVISIFSGTGVGQKRDVSDFVQSTSVISVSPNWTTNPDNTSIYNIIKSYTNKIRLSFEKVETMFYNKGRRHSLILESSQIKMPLLYLTIHFIALDLRKELDDKWDLLSIDYMKKFDQSFNTMKVSYDADESGFISDEEEQRGIASLRISRA